jgi:hypothetical protein
MKNPHSHNHLVMKLIILSLLYFVSGFFILHGQVTIIGNLPNRQDGEIISFDKPIGIFPATFYLDKGDNCTISNQSINTTIPLPNKGIIYIYEKPYASPLLSFYAEPGDTIIFREFNKKFLFEGKNAKANEIYANKKMFADSVGIDNFQPVDLFINKNLEESIKFSFELKKNEFINRFRRLFENKEITQNCDLSFEELITQNIYGWAASLAISFRDNPEVKAKYRCKLDNNKLNDLALYFTAKCSSSGDNSFISKMLGNTIMVNASCKKYIVKDKASFKKAKWHLISNGLSKEFKEIEMFDFIDDDRHKEMIFGSTILLLVQLQAVERENAKQAFGAFKENFPKSIFIKPIENQLGINEEEVDILSKNDFSYLGKISFYDSKIGLTISNKSVESKTFEELLREKFPNESVFIDGWATYCSPCIKEFANSKNLYKFLKTKNIEMFYISVDQDVSLQRWKKMISDYNLNGYHLFASDKLRDIFNGPFQLIPSYYFYSNGKLKKISGVPSDEEKFYSQFK